MPSGNIITIAASSNSSQVKSNVQTPRFLKSETWRRCPNCDYRNGICAWPVETYPNTVEKSLLKEFLIKKPIIAKWGWHGDWWKWWCKGWIKIYIAFNLVINTQYVFYTNTQFRKCLSKKCLLWLYQSSRVLIWKKYTSGITTCYTEKMSWRILTDLRSACVLGFEDKTDYVQLLCNQPFPHVWNIHLFLRDGRVA